MSELDEEWENEGTKPYNCIFCQEAREDEPFWTVLCFDEEDSPIDEEDSPLWFETLDEAIEFAKVKALEGQTAYVLQAIRRVTPAEPEVTVLSFDELPFDPEM